MSAYAASKAALNAQALNLAAGLAGTGVTVSVLRPGMADTAMPAWIRAQLPAQIGAARHERFVTMGESGVMAFPPPPCCHHRRADHRSDERPDRGCGQQVN